MSANLISSLSQSYGSKILPNLTYRTLPNPYFIPNDGEPIAVTPGKVTINDALVVNGATELNGAITENGVLTQNGGMNITGTLNHQYNNPNSYAETYASYISSGTSNASLRASYVLYNGNETGGGIEASTLQMFAYTPGNIAYNFQVLPQGGVYVPSGSANTFNANALSVSTINGAPPQGGSAVTMLSTFTLVNSTNLPNYFTTFPSQPDSYYEVAMSGRVVWTGAPGAGDVLTFGWNGGSTQFVDNCRTLIAPGQLGSNLSGGAGFYDFAISGVLQTSATGSNVEPFVDVPYGNPADYTWQVSNGFVKFLKPQ